MTFVRSLDLPGCHLPWSRGTTDPATLVEHEWLVTNGLGGYSSGTVAGVVTRRYHGLLIAALPNPLGRLAMLNAMIESVAIDGGKPVRLNSEHRAGAEPDIAFADALAGFWLDGGIPTWRFELDGAVIEKRVLMPYRQNTVIVNYRMLNGGDRALLQLAPLIHFRQYEAPVSSPLPEDYSFSEAEEGGHFVVTAAELPSLRIGIEGRFSFKRDEQRLDQMLYRIEERRGYEFEGALWTPGAFALDIHAGESVALVASTEPFDVMSAMNADEALDVEHRRKRRLIEAAGDNARDDVGRHLVLAADQFIIKPVGRVRDTVRASAAGEEVRTVIAGYHWFTDWGRDTMISLAGLTLNTGRHREAGFILRTFAHYVREGLIPNMFPDGSDEGLYHTADATLWFFQALQQYAEVTGYWQLIEDVLPVARDIVDHHTRGTRFGIAVDSSDGLLRQGLEGYQLTWMDAKVDDWVVTPRWGKAVEINALWYNALCLMSRWERDHGDRKRSDQYSAAARRVRESFNERFWCEATGHLYDVIDGPEGDDPACRPNQLFAIALPNPVLDRSRWTAVVEVVRERLLTPVGLRSLAPDHPDYKSRYYGDLRARDAAYHQGTVWGWLIGPWVDAWLKVHPEDRAGARRFLHGLVARLPEFGVGSIAEIFDADPPFTPRGCIAQAWSIAEALRCWAKTADQPDTRGVNPAPN